MKTQKIPFLSNRLGVSYAISAVIMTVTTITLVLVASTYAYQILEQQRGMSEFEVAEKSILAFDDAVRDIAWDPQGSRSVRFTVDYGHLELLPNNTVKGLPLKVNVTDYPNANYSSYTGYVKYCMSTKYVTFGNGYQSYILGDNTTIATKSTESFGRALIEQESGWINITFSYRVRAMRTSVVQVGNDTVNYVDVYIIKIVVTKWSSYVGDLDLVARNVGITTKSYGPYDVDDDDCKIKVSLGESNDETEISLDPGKVVFNFIIAEIKVSP